MQDRSKGVLVLALLSVVEGILGFVGGLALMLGGSLGAVWGAESGGITLTLGAVMFALGLMGLALGWGFWSRKNWAWAVGLVVFGVSIVVNVATVLLAGATFLSAVLPVVVSAGVIWYLLKPDVRSVFGQTSVTA